MFLQCISHLWIVFAWFSLLVFPNFVVNCHRACPPLAAVAVLARGVNVTRAYCHLCFGGGKVG